jgi:ferrous iron transport protein A
LRVLEPESSASTNSATRAHDATHLNGRKNKHARQNLATTIFTGQTSFCFFAIANHSHLREFFDMLAVLENKSKITLNEVALNCEVRITALEGPACDRLRELGFCEEMQLRKLSNGRNLVCSLCGSKMAISRELASHILVAPSH